MRPPTLPARSVVREIDRELERLEEYEKAVASQRELLLRARAALAVNRDVRRRERISTMELLKYVGKHPGCSVEQIAEALQARVTSVCAQLHRGRNVRYECREGGWHLRPPPHLGRTSRCQQQDRIEFDGAADVFQALQRQVTLASLELSHVCAAPAKHVGKCFLAQLSRPPVGLEVLADGSL